jgi:predicted GTPase
MQPLPTPFPRRQLEVAEGLLVQNQPIDVAILGQFKAGKSSFINSLLGKSILPVGAIQLQQQLPVCNTEPRSG